MEFGDHRTWRRASQFWPRALFPGEPVSPVAACGLCAANELTFTEQTKRRSRQNNLPNFLSACYASSAAAPPTKARLVATPLSILFYFIFYFSSFSTSRPILPLSSSSLSILSLSHSLSPLFFSVSFSGSGSCSICFLRGLSAALHHYHSRSLPRSSSARRHSIYPPVNSFEDSTLIDPGIVALFGHFTASITSKHANISHQPRRIGTQKLNTYNFCPFSTRRRI